MSRDRLGGLRALMAERKRILDEAKARLQGLRAQMRDAEEAEETAHRNYLKARDAVETEEMRHG